MSLSRKRRRKHEQRRHHEAHPAPVDGLHDGEAARLSPERLFALRIALDKPTESPLRKTGGDPRDVEKAPPTAPSAGAIREARVVQRLAYTRRQAAEALGVSISTIDRRVVPAMETIKLPWGQRLIPVDELKPFSISRPEGFASCVHERAHLSVKPIPIGRRMFENRLLVRRLALSHQA